MDIKFGMEQVLYGYESLINYNENYVVPEDIIEKILNILEKVGAQTLVYAGYANRPLIEILNEEGYKVHVIHVFEQTISPGYYEYQAKVFDEYYCSEGIPEHDVLLIDVPIPIYSEMHESKSLLFGESNRKFYKNTKYYKYINLAKENNLYLIDKVSTYTFDRMIRRKY